MEIYKPEYIHCNGERFRIYLTNDEILDRIKKLGEAVTRDYTGKKPIFIGVLNGAFVFLADLMRYVTIPCEVDFLKLSSYGDEKVSSGQVTELKEVDADIRGRHVILVEDIVDTGLSMNFLTEKLRRHKPASLATITLLHKSEKTLHDVKLDYVGFRIPSLFVLGYGLDFAQEGRNLAQIYIQDDSNKSSAGNENKS